MKKKILVIPSWYPEISNPNLGGFIRDQIELVSDEFDLKVLAGKQNNSKSRFSKLLNTIKYLLFKSISTCKNDNIFDKQHEVFGFEYEKGLNLMEKMNFDIMIESYLKLFENSILNNWKPDIIHAHNSNVAGIIAKVISSKYSIPYIITEHHHLNSNLPNYISERIIESLKSSKCNCFVSDWQYRTFLLSDSAISGVISGNPVDTKLFDFRENDSEEFVITHLSNADVSKDIKTLFLSLNEFFLTVDRHSNVKVKIAGFPDSVIHKVKQEFANSTWMSNIEFFPVLNKEQVTGLLQSSSVYLHTSIFESFGLAPLEAISCGVPIICTDNGGVNEYIIEGVNGLICKLRDYKMISDSLLQVYNGDIKFNSKVVRKSLKEKHTNSGFKDFMSVIYNSL